MTFDRRVYVHAIKLERGCMDCGYRSHPSALDFDYRPGEVKVFNICSNVQRSWAVIETEIAKCDVVCANCHRIRTVDRVRETGHHLRRYA